MSLCQAVADCIINEGKRESIQTIDIGLAMYAVTVITGVLPLAASYSYLADSYRGDFIATIVGIETLALLITLSPLCINQFISQLTWLTQGPLCRSILSQWKIRQNLQWAVKELTHVAGFNRLLKDHLKSVMYYQGILRIALGVTAIYHVLRMRNERRVNSSDLGFIFVATAMVLDFGIVLTVMGSGASKAETLFTDCLMLNQTIVK